MLYKNHKLLLGLLGILALAAVGCSSSPKKVTKSLGEETYTDGNRAPASMAPQEGETTVIDPNYQRAQADYHFTLGEAYSLEGQSNRAIEEYKLTLIFDQESPTVHLKISSEYVKKGMINEAIDHAEMAVKLDSTLVDARFLLGGLYSAMKVYDKALGHYQEIIRQQPNNYESYLYIGALYAEQEKPDDAIEMFQKVAKMPSSTAVHLAHYYTGRIYAEQKNQKKALEFYEKTLQAKGDFVEGVLSLGSLYEKEGQKDKMVSLYLKFQDKYGPNERIAEPLAKYYLEKEDYEKAYRQYEIISAGEPDNLTAKVKMALILIEKKDYTKAIGKLKEIIAQAPDSDKIRFYLGAVYEEIKDYKLAIEQFKTIPASSVFFEEANVHAAYLYKTMNDYSNAISVIEKAIADRADIPQFYALYASLLDDQKQYAKAAELLKVAVEKFPKSDQLNFFMGSMLDKVGDRKNTVVYMKKVLEINPGHIQALNYLAYTYAEMGENLDEAEKLVRRALEFKDDDAYVRDTLGWVLYKQGKFEDAVRELEKAYSLKSGESIIAEHLGDAYFRFQLPNKAKAMYNKAVQLESDEKSIEKLRGKIKSLESDASSRTPASITD